MTKELRKQLEEKLGVYYVSPHSPAPGTTWEYDSCGDCFCTLQTVHSHSRNEELVEPVVKLIDSWTDEIIGEPTFCDDKCANRSSTLHVACVDTKNELIAEQRQRAGLPETP